MPRVVFTPNLERHVQCPPEQVDGNTVREALEAIFSGNPRLRSYIVDDQQRLRQHVMIFVDGRPVVDRQTLSDRVSASSDVYVMQALSGG